MLCARSLPSGLSSCAPCWREALGPHRGRRSPRSRERTSSFACTAPYRARTCSRASGAARSAASSCSRTRSRPAARCRWFGSCRRGRGGGGGPPPPPLLIAIDQEGGGVKRLPGPPEEAPSQMRSAAVAFASGRATGRYLHGLGIGVDLAPVLDVPVSPYAFIYARAFSTDPATVSANGVAFAQGLGNGGVAGTVKHFPGLGRLGRSTDYGSGKVAASRTALAARDLAPFRAAIAGGVPLVMVGTAVYPAYDRVPAACSPAIVNGLLRGTLGFRGVTMSDDLATRGVSPWFDAGEAT